MALLNPRQIDHIKKLQPQFRFKLRKVHVPPGEGEGDADNLTGGTMGGDDAGAAANNSLMDDEGGEDDATVAHGNGAPNGRGQASSGTPQDATVSVRGPGGVRQNRSSTPEGGANSAISTSGMFMPGGCSGGMSHEDQILLDRIKWMIQRFSAPIPSKAMIPVLKPSQEVRTESVQEVVLVAAAAAGGDVEKKGSHDGAGGSDNDDDDDDDDKSQSRRRNCFDEDEGKAAVEGPPEPIVKTVRTTTITWTPGEVESPVRGPILHSSKPSLIAEEQPGNDDDDVAAVALAKPTITLHGVATVINITTSDAVVGQVATPSMVWSVASSPTTDAQARLEDIPVEAPPPFQADMATKMFLGVINFLFTGDASNLAPEDRHNWLETVLRSQNNGDLGADLSQTLPTSETVMGEKSWREALLYLRTVFPGAGNYSGVGAELDDAETAMYWRIAEMRENLTDNTKRSANKLLLARRSAASTGKSLEVDPVDSIELLLPINPYASNLSVPDLLEPQEATEGEED